MDVYYFYKLVKILHIIEINYYINLPLIRLKSN